MRTLTKSLCLLIGVMVANQLPLETRALAQTPDLKGSLLGTRYAFEDLRTATRSFQRTVEKYEAEHREKYRNKHAAFAQKQLPNLKTLAQNLRDEIAALKGTGSGQQSIKLYEEYLKYYESQIAEAEKKLAKPNEPSPDSPPSDRPTVNEPLGEPTSDAAPSPGSPESSNSSPDLESVRREVDEIYNELVLFQEYRHYEFHERLTDRCEIAFQQYGASYVVEWVGWFRHYTGGGMSMHGEWMPVTQAIHDFQSVLYYSTDYYPAHSAYLKYLKSIMSYWNQDMKRKREYMLQTIDLTAQMGLARDADDDEWRAEIAEQIGQRYKEIHRKPPFTIKHFKEWQAAPEQLDSEFARAEIPAQGSILSKEDVAALMQKLERGFDAQRMAKHWIQDLMQEPPTILVDPDGALKLDGSFIDTVVLPIPIDVSNPSPEQLSKLAEKLFQYWSITVPEWYQLELKPDQQAAVTEFLSSRLRGLPFTDSLKNSLKVGQAKGGTARDSLQALEMMRKYFREENLLGHYQDRKDKVAWEELKLGDFNGDLSVDPRDFSNWELSLGEHPQ